MDSLVGKTYGMLTVIEELGIEWIYGKKRNAIRCQCLCGKERVFATSLVLAGKHKSCGCGRGHDIEAYAQKLRDLQAGKRDKEVDEYREKKRSVLRGFTPREGSFRTLALPENQVIEIRERTLDGPRGIQAMLANSLNVSPQVVSAIVRGERHARGKALPE